MARPGNAQAANPKNIRRNIMAHTCSYCKGSGYVPCNRCGGEGTFVDNSKWFNKEETCPHCQGSGKRECPACNGRGEIDD